MSFHNTIVIKINTIGYIQTMKLKTLDRNSCVELKGFNDEVSNTNKGQINIGKLKANKNTIFMLTFGSLVCLMKSGSCSISDICW